MSEQRVKILTAGDSDNPIRALNTHGQTGTCLEHGSQLSSGKGHAGISPSASGQSDQEAERPAVRTIREEPVSNDIPRRCRLDLNTPAERAIYDAMQEVEKAGADVRLTDAVILLGEARDAVADFVDDAERTKRRFVRYEGDTPTPAPGAPDAADRLTPHSDLELATCLVRTVCGPAPTRREWDGIAEQVRAVAFELQRRAERARKLSEFGEKTGASPWT